MSNYAARIAEFCTIQLYIACTYNTGKSKVILLLQPYTHRGNSSGAGEIPVQIMSRSIPNSSGLLLWEWGMVSPRKCWATVNHWPGNCLHQPKGSALRSKAQWVVNGRNGFAVHKAPLMFWLNESLFTNNCHYDKKKIFKKLRHMWWHVNSDWNTFVK